MGLMIQARLHAICRFAICGYAICGYVQQGMQEMRQSAGAINASPVDGSSVVSFSSEP